MHGVFFYVPDEIAEAREVLGEAQDGACAICGAVRARLIPDHCHRHGIIRGLLCNSCNTGLGMFRDDPRLLARAIEYVVEASETVARMEEGQGLDRERLRRWRLAAQERSQRVRAEAFAKSDRSDL
jgi:hypothetical protein